MHSRFSHAKRRNSTIIHSVNHSSMTSLRHWHWANLIKLVNLLIISLAVCKSRSRITSLLSKTNLSTLRYESTLHDAMKLAAAIFMDSNKDVYPYSDIPCTRTGYYPKWLLASSKNRQGQIWRECGYYVIKSSCLSHDNVQNLIMSGDVLPLPAIFGEVVDSLETWGATHWSCWLQKSLKLFHEYLKEDNMCGGVAPCKMRVFHDCILLCVENVANCHFNANSANYNLVLTSWNTYYWVKCWEVPLFWELAYHSMMFVENQIECIHRANTPALVVATAHVVPESPTSSP